MDSLDRLQKKLLACVRNADYDFGLIKKGDRILIGLSGGKDSLVLLKVLSIYRKFKDKDFEIAAAHIDFGFKPVDFSKVEQLCQDLDVPYYSVDAKEVAQILEQHRDPNTHLLPCSICSRMRKAVINKTAQELGFKKVAFAHHADDAIETLFLNMAYGGRVSTFEPKMHLDRADIDFIRPLIYADEDMIRRYAKLENLPIAKNTCGNDKKTNRERIKVTLAEIYKDYPDAHNNFQAMLTNPDQFKLYYDRLGSNPSDEYEIRKCFNKKDFLGVASVEANAVNKDKEDFSDSYDYWILLKEGKPKAYLKVEERDVGEKHINLLTAAEDASAEDVIKLIDIYEKKKSMEHVPTDVYFDGTVNRDIFITFGYEDSGDSLKKTVSKSLKI